MNPSVTEIAHVSQGPTALFGVFGMTIKTLGEGLASLREKGRVVEAILTILSGGHEGVSLNDGFEKSFRMITKQMTKKPLGHLFPSADDDSIASATQINIAYGKAQGCNPPNTKFSAVRRAPAGKSGPCETSA